MSLTNDAPSPTTPTSLADHPAIHYDPLSYTSYDHPYETYRELRDRAPVYYAADRDLWVISRYADVRACLRNHAQLINALGNDIDGTHDSYGVGMLVCQDPPRHTVLRDAIRRTFNGREVQALEPETRAVARRLVADFHTKGGGDFVADVALPVIFDVSMRLVGLPVDQGDYFAAHLLRSMARTVGEFGVPEDASAANREAEDHIAEIVARRRADIEAGADASGADAVTQILLAVERGKVHPDEVDGLTHLVLSASTDAPAAFLSNCVAVLDRFPMLQRELAADPSKVAAFIEEVARFDSPAQNLCRQSIVDLEIAGATIPANSRVMVLLASANRDERVFPNPDDFILGRVIADDAKPLMFGEGIHSCMGAPVARLTAQVLVEELVALGSELRVVGMPERWVKQMVRGYSRLPVRFVRSLAEESKVLGAAHLRSSRLAPGAGWAVTVDESGHLQLVETRVRVEAKTSVADDVVTLTLRAVDGSPLPAWEPGAHVDLVLGEAPTRQYSLCGPLHDRDAYRVGILRNAQGSGGSLYVHDTLQAGDVLTIRGPRNNFGLVESSEYIFIAGGIGITPILPMIDMAERLGARWTLHYGGRQRASMAFLDELAKYGDRVVLHPHDEVGLLDLDAILGAPRQGVKVYCCGPEPLLNAVEGRCHAWPRRTLHVERFNPKPLSEPVLHAAFEVKLTQSGLTLTVPEDRSILDVIRDAGVAVLSSCKEGTCGTCETVVLGGVPDHRDSVLDEEARADGATMMICVSRSVTPRLTLDV